MHRFFIESNLNKDNEYCLDASISHQIKNVLRMKEGDFFELFNNSGNLFEAKILDSSNNLIKCKIISSLNAVNESLKINVFQSIIKISKMELVIEKLTEIGIFSFTPIITERVQKKDIDSFSESKLNRLKKISIEASEQSGKVFIPYINNKKSIKNLDLTNDKNKNIVFYESSKGAIKLKKIDQKILENRTISVFIGPVGGFSQYEIEHFKRNGCILVNLGNTIFKSDTASIIGVSLLKYMITENLN
tara:strand:- start:3791 stop:4531 length:741 start_codon:yes stop_codon:yes gene_type:complete